MGQHCSAVAHFFKKIQSSADAHNTHTHLPYAEAELHRCLSHGPWSPYTALLFLACNHVSEAQIELTMAKPQNQFSKRARGALAPPAQHDCLPTCHTDRATVGPTSILIPPFAPFPRDEI
jgi:hypothetical protein